MEGGENNRIMPSITFCNLNGKPTAARLMYFKLQKFTSQNLVYQAAVFCVRNALKVTYEHLRFEKIFRGLYPWTPVKRGREDIGRERKGRHGRTGRGREERGKAGRGRGRKGRTGGKRVVPPRFNLVPLASLGLATALYQYVLKLCICDVQWRSQGARGHVPTLSRSDPVV
jgi:hypothetical protein